MQENRTPDVEEVAFVDAALDVEEESWNPEPGDKVIGALLGVERIATKVGSVPVLRIGRADGTVARVMAGRKVLRSELERKKAQPGDTVGILYVGEAKSKDGQPFFNYRVVVVEKGPRGAECFVAEPSAMDGLTAEARQAASGWDDVADVDEGA